MTLAVWRDEYITGHDTIDQQHRTLFDQVNELHALTQKQPQDRAVIRQLLTAFAEQATSHFELEEMLMAQYQYPNLTVHSNTHRALVNKVRSVLDKLNQDEANVAIDVAPVLADWMVHHIRGEDQQMIRFFKKQMLSTVK